MFEGFNIQAEKVRRVADSLLPFFSVKCSANLMRQEERAVGVTVSSPTKLWEVSSRLKHVTDTINDLHPFFTYLQLSLVLLISCGDVPTE